MPAPTKPYTFSNTPTNTNIIDADQVNANFDTLYSLLNKGLDASNTTNAFAKDNVEPAFERYKVLRSDSSPAVSLTAQTYLFTPGGVSAGSGSSGPSSAVFYYDRADLAAGSRATKWRVRASLLTNGGAPGVNFTFGLYPITAVGGAGANFTLTIGTVVSGSTVPFTSPTASTLAQGNSGDFDAPVAGWYALGVVVSGSQSGIAAMTAQLQYRQV